MKQAVLHKVVPLDGPLVLEGVSWSEYSAFLRAFAERPAFRLTYDQGTLEIMSPRLEHDDPGRFLGQLVWVLTDELGLPIRAGGSTTMRRKLKKKGVEADECFWIANAYRMQGRRNLDLRRDPPPDDRTRRHRAVHIARGPLAPLSILDESLALRRRTSRL